MSTRTDAKSEMMRILDADGAELIRQGKHPIYRLSQGERFTMAATPSDWRGSRNDLGVLKRIIAAREPINITQAHPKPQTTMAVVRAVAVADNHTLNRGSLGDALVGALSVPEPEPVVGVEGTEVQPSLPLSPPAPNTEPTTPTSAAAAPPIPSLRERILTAIQEVIAEKERLTTEAGRLLVEADQAEKRVKFLEGLQEYAEDPNVENMLRALLPAPPPPPPPAPTPRTVRIEPTRERHLPVSRERVMAAVAMFDGPFNLDQLSEGMYGVVEDVDPEEWNRSRRCLRQAVTALIDRGLMVLVERGNAHKPPVYQRAKVPAGVLGQVVHSLRPTA